MNGGFGFDLKFDTLAVRGGPPFIFGIPSGVWYGFHELCDVFIVAEDDVESIVAGFND